MSRSVTPAYYCLLSGPFLYSQFLTWLLSLVPPPEKSKLKSTDVPSTPKTPGPDSEEASHQEVFFQPPSVIHKKVWVTSLFIYILSISPCVSLTKVISFVSLCRRRNPRRKPVLKIFDSSLLHKRQRQDVLFLVSHPMMVDWLKTSLQTV